MVPMHDAPPWPRPPSALPSHRLDEPPEGAVVTVAGLVLVRQRPGTAKGVIFVTLEDEFGVVNVVVWKKTYERFRRAVIAGRLLRVTGRIQRDGIVVHVIADTVEDISWMLDDLVRGADAPEVPRSRPLRRGHRAMAEPPDQVRGGGRPVSGSLTRPG